MRNNPLLKTVMATIAEQTSGSKAYISEANLAEKISISRTRLRETLQTLNAYGLIEKRQKLGVTIKQVTRESMQETYELRELLEAHAIKNTLKYVTAEDITQLYNIEQTAKLAVQVGDWPMTAQYDLKFHRKIIDIARLPLLNRILDNLHLIENSFINDVISEHEIEWLARKPNPYTHHAIVDALASGDKKCVNLLKKHIQWVKQKELKIFDRKNNQQPTTTTTTTTQPINQGDELLAAINC